MLYDSCSICSYAVGPRHPRRGRFSPSACPVVPYGFLKEASRCVIEVARYIAFNDPLVDCPTVTSELLSYVSHSVIGASVWPESVGVDTEIGFPYWFQDHAKGFLNNPVQQGWDAISRLHILSSPLSEQSRSGILSTPCVATRCRSAIYAGWESCLNTSWSTLTGVS